MKIKIKTQVWETKEKLAKTLQSITYASFAISAANMFYAAAKNNYYFFFANGLLAAISLIIIISKIQYDKEEYKKRKELEEYLGQKK